MDTSNSNSNLTLWQQLLHRQAVLDAHNGRCSTSGLSDADRAIYLGAQLGYKLHQTKISRNEIQPSRTTDIWEQRHDGY